MDRDQRAQRLADRFHNAWKRLEQHLTSTYGQAVKADGRQLQDWLYEAYRREHLKRDSWEFLDSCRRVRNAYAHITYQGYSGPVAIPPEAALTRLESLVDALTRPPKIREHAVPAVRCAGGMPLTEAMTMMRDHDFSQLPYEAEADGWRVLTREQIACFVAARIRQEEVEIVSFEGVRASDVVDYAPSTPLVLSGGHPVQRAIELMTHALEQPTRSQYPAIVVTDPADPDRVGVVLPQDLPRLYEAVGR